MSRYTATCWKNCLFKKAALKTPVTLLKDVLKLVVSLLLVSYSPALQAKPSPAIHLYSASLPPPASIKRHKTCVRERTAEIQSWNIKGNFMPAALSIRVKLPTIAVRSSPETLNSRPGNQPESVKRKIQKIDEDGGDTKSQTVI